MSWLFSQALVEEYLAANCSDGAPSALSKSTLTAQAYLCKDKMTESWSHFPSGMTLEHLTEENGQELLTWFLAVSHARILASPALVKDLMENEAAFGKKWPESLAKYDLNTHSWKTRQLSLIADLERSLVTWLKWGMIHDVEYFQHVPLVAHIHVRDCFSWPTPTASDHHGPTKYIARKPNGRWILKKPSGIYGAKLIDAIGGIMNPLWEEWLIGWPIGWTESNPLEMAKFHQWLNLHGIL
jgi:hypothetical protein